MQGEYRYWWGSDNLNAMFETAKLMSSVQEQDSFIDNLDKEDMINQVLQRRPNTKYVFIRAINLIVKVFPIEHSLIGAMVDLPSHLKTSKSVMTLQRDQYKNIFQYPDCAFRCLAAHLNENKLPTNPQREIDKLKSFYKRFWKLEHDFDGSMTVPDLDQMEIAFNVKITVYKSKQVELKKGRNGNLVEEEESSGEESDDMTDTMSDNMSVTMSDNISVASRSKKIVVVPIRTSRRRLVDLLLYISYPSLFQECQ